MALTEPIHRAQEQGGVGTGQVDVDAAWAVQEDLEPFPSAEEQIDPGFRVAGWRVDRGFLRGPR
ncbi:MAG TPA: hypothetical protein VMV09_05715 [Candidatus Saccharimonadales bacterium]|nr:hypothetical protein [Candidatus Saccharimonadales bacterium]